MTTLTYIPEVYINKYINNFSGGNEYNGFSLFSYLFIYLYKTDLYYYYYYYKNKTLYLFIYIKQKRGGCNK